MIRFVWYFLFVWLGVFPLGGAVVVLLIQGSDIETGISENGRIGIFSAVAFIHMLLCIRTMIWVAGKINSGASDYFFVKGQGFVLFKKK